MAAGEIKNVVLVHGGFVDGSGWEGVYKALTKNGYTVAIVQNPTDLTDILYRFDSEYNPKYERRDSGSPFACIYGSSGRRGPRSRPSAASLSQSLDRGRSRP